MQLQNVNNDLMRDQRIGVIPPLIGLMRIDSSPPSSLCRLVESFFILAANLPCSQRTSRRLEPCGLGWAGWAAEWGGGGEFLCSHCWRQHFLQNGTAGSFLEGNFLLIWAGTNLVPDPNPSCGLGWHSKTLQAVQITKWPRAQITDRTKTFLIGIGFAGVPR
jgi:hypothetical protein